MQFSNVFLLRRECEKKVKNMTTKCDNCGVELGEEHPRQNGMCIDCFVADWGELVEKYPMASPKILLSKQDDKIK